MSNRMNSLNPIIMRNLLLIGLLAISVPINSQIMTLIATLDNGLRDTVKFGFVQNGTLGEDISLGEMNVFMTPVNGFQGRILQRDSSNFSCAMKLDRSRIYYPANFDSKINYRNSLDTSLQNRLFEVWYSDNNTDSLEMICDIPFKSFFSDAFQYPIDCLGDPPSPVGIWVNHDDTIKHIKYALQPGLGIRQQIFITKPNITITSLDDNNANNSKMQISIFPNPTSSSLFVQSVSIDEFREIFIYSSIGKLVEQFNSMPTSFEIDLSHLQTGIYTVVFVLRNGGRVSKMVFKL